jgi:uncharacterized protein YukE
VSEAKLFERTGCGLDAVLAPPVAERPVPMLLDIAMAGVPWWDNTMNVVLGMAGGADLLGGLAAALVGDWTEVARSADALDRLSQFTSGYAAQLRELTAELPQVWEGAAAQQCRAYLNDLARRLDDAAQALARCADDYRDVTVGVYECAQGIGQVMPLVVEVVAQVAAVTTIGILSAETLIGPVIAGMVGVERLSRLAALVNTIRRYHDSAVAACQIFSGILITAMTPLDQFPTVALPRPGDRRPTAA